MRPPLRIGDALAVGVWGTVPTTTDEVRAIQAWLSSIQDEYARQPSKVDQYTAHPAWRDVEDDSTKVLRYRRYSCAGFVVRAYHEAGIQLLPIVEDRQGRAHVDPARLPDVPRELIAAVYPIAAINSGLLAHWGLDGPGPWPVLLPGYVLHALARGEAEIRCGPYLPKAGDAEF